MTRHHAIHTAGMICSLIVLHFVLQHVHYAVAMIPAPTGATPDSPRFMLNEIGATFIVTLCSVALVLAPAALALRLTQRRRPAP